MPRLILSLLLIPVALSGLAMPATAQSYQFQRRATVLPAETLWTEGAVVIDIEGDGDLDLVLANGEGYLTAEDPLAPQVFVNTGVSAGLPVMVDESGARFPAFTQWGREVIAFDMEGDGDDDLFFSNAFDSQQRLLRNDGTGHFTDVTATHFTLDSMNSFGACAFDRDDDGDLDLAVCDHGGTDQIGPGAIFRLYDNDGAGVFTDVSATDITGLAKAGQQNITPVDIDGDFDVDLVLDGKSMPMHLYLNDGAGSFTLDSAVLPPASPEVYESDWADLDGDGDFDGFILTYETLVMGGDDATAENHIAGSGSLSFTGSTGTLDLPNGFDDNEVLFIDYDDDGDLDPLIGSLQGNRDRMYRNDGNFEFRTTALIEPLGPDPTLDVVAGDFDGDGDYDLFMVQGEAPNPVGWRNWYYENVGPADTTGPSFLGVEALPTPAGATTVVHVNVQDGLRDDGEVYVELVADWTTDQGSGSVVATHMGGGLFRAAIPTVGASTLAVNWIATDAVGNVSSVNLPDGPWAVAGPGTAGISGIPQLAGTGTLTPSSPVGIALTAAAPSSPTFLFVGITALNLPFLGGTLVPAFEPPFGLIIILVTSPGGEVALSSVWPATLPSGFNVYLQAFIEDVAHFSGYASSNAVRGTVR